MKWQEEYFSYYLNFPLSASFHQYSLLSTFKTRLNRRTGLHVSPKEPALQDLWFSIMLLKNHVFSYDTPR
jgi:hypothetical protein